MKKTKSILLILTFIIGITGLMITMQSCEEQENTDNLVKIGVYDSRILALVYYRSELFSDSIQQLKNDRKEAMESGDDDLVALLDKIGPGSQDLAHKQAFSTMPIPNILELITDSIPVIANRNELDVIMNKWEIIYQEDEVEFIDITKEMLSFFEPSEETLKQVNQMFDVNPVPLKEILREDVETWCDEF